MVYLLQVLHLKVGAPVVLTQNVMGVPQLVNGLTGIVEALYPEKIDVHWHQLDRTMTIERTTFVE